MRKPSGKPAGRRGRLVVIVAGRGTQILDVAGPAEVFSRCDRILRDRDPSQGRGYRLKLLSISDNDPSIATTTGIGLTSAGAFSSLRERPDTLIIAGGEDVEELRLDARFTKWILRESKHTRRIAAICTGAFALGEAGLLARRRCTTHWAYCERLAHSFPDAIVDPDPIWVRDGKVFTSAGVTAGMDLALALVEEDFGAAMALRIARELVLFLRRPGTQSQFSAPMAAQIAERQTLRELQLWLSGNLTDDLSVSALSERANMSVRNFSRAFKQETGTTPGEYVDRLRIEAVCLRLADSSEGLSRIAAQCGFASPDVMRRAMLRIRRITPDDYRARFGNRHAFRDG